MNLDSKLVRVTFFEDRAEVEREVFCTLSGPALLRVGGLSPLIDDPSLMVGTDCGRIHTSKVERQSLLQTASVEELDRFQQEIWEKEAEIARLRAHEKRLNLQLQQHQALLQRAADALKLAPADPVLPVLDAVSVLDSLAGIAEKLQKAGRELEFLKQAFAKARESRSQLETSVLIAIEGQGPARLRLRYLLPCALWRPALRARLIASEVILEQLAVVWQLTGEHWEGVEAVFSTARTARSASPPLLTEDVLMLQPRPPEEKRVQIEAREVAIQSTSVGGKSRDVNELPGVEDGGQPARFSIKQLTLASDGKPVFLNLQQQRFPAKLEICAWPEKSTAAQLRASLTAASTPILPGPVYAIRQNGATEAYMGVSRVGFIAPGQPFELGFGVEDGIRIRRTTEEKTETTPVIGSKKRTTIINLFISNLSDQPCSLKLIERIPVSEISDVRITLQEGGEADSDGLLKIPVSVGPGETVEKTLKYVLEASSRVVLP